MTYMEKVRSILSNIDPECYIGNKSLIQKLNEKRVHAARGRVYAAGRPVSGEMEGYVGRI